MYILQSIGVQRTAPSNAGIVASTAPRNTKLMTMFGLFGSDLKLWCISGSFPYLNGFSCEGIATLESRSRVSENALLLYPVEVPKEAITMLAESGEELRSICRGRSLCVCVLALTAGSTNSGM